MSKAVAIVSGGMDSVTLAHMLVKRGKQDLTMLFFNYGQRHVKEQLFAEHHARELRAQYRVVDLRSVTTLLSGSALTDPNVEVPEGHYAAENMKLTVVPNRNAMMLSVAWGVAVAQGASAVATAVHAGDHAIYPDCRPEFITQLSRALATGNEGFGDPMLYIMAPFVYMSKADIVRVGADIGVDFGMTWSCYKGRELHCGKCGTCVERIEAFELAGVPDPTHYAA